MVCVYVRAFYNLFVIRSTTQNVIEYFIEASSKCSCHNHPAAVFSAIFERFIIPGAENQSESSGIYM